MKLSSKHIGLLLLVLSCLPTITSLVLSVHTAWIRHEMLERLEQEQLHRIVLRADQVNWYEKGSELIINGELFDVEQYHQEENSFVFYGLFDREETAISNWLEKNSNGNQEDKMLAQLFLHFLKFQCNSPADTNPEIACLARVSQYSSYWVELPISPFVAKSTPPPNYFFA